MCPDVIKSRHRAAWAEKSVQYSGLAHNASLFVPFVPIILNEIVQTKYKCVHCQAPYNKTSMYKEVLKLKKEARRGNEWAHAYTQRAYHVSNIKMISSAQRLTRSIFHSNRRLYWIATSTTGILFWSCTNDAFLIYKQYFNSYNVLLRQPSSTQLALLVRTWL